jgi:hypothetical protein
VLCSIPKLETLGNSSLIVGNVTCLTCCACLQVLQEGAVLVLRCDKHLRRAGHAVWPQHLRYSWCAFWISALLRGSLVPLVGSLPAVSCAVQLHHSLALLLMCFALSAGYSALTGGYEVRMLHAPEMLVVSDGIIC